jgi:hypothetical protein
MADNNATGKGGRSTLMQVTWQTAALLRTWLLFVLLPVPAGLNVNQWHDFAVFAAVIAGLILESMPGGAVGLIGLTFTSVMGHVEPDPNKSLRWMLRGFSEGTVWLIVGAFVFSIGCRMNGLGKRIALVSVRALGRHTTRVGQTPRSAFTLRCCSQTPGSLMPHLGRCTCSGRGLFRRKHPPHLPGHTLRYPAVGKGQERLCATAMSL